MVKPGRLLPREEWIARCVARMLALDPVTDRQALEAIVADLADRARWRSCAPEAAADLLFGPVGPNAKWPASDLGSLAGDA